MTKDEIIKEIFESCVDAKEFRRIINANHYNNAHTKLKLSEYAKGEHHALLNLIEALGLVNEYGAFCESIKVEG